MTTCTAVIKGEEWKVAGAALPRNKGDSGEGKEGRGMTFLHREKKKSVHQLLLERLLQDGHY